MLSETLATGLEHYKNRPEDPRAAAQKKAGLGATRRAHRAVARHAVQNRAGSTLSTLPTLLRIALVFGVGLEHFFIEGKDRSTVAVIRKRDRLRLLTGLTKLHPLIYSKASTSRHRSKDGGILRRIPDAVETIGAA